jgi:hypothetical protein
MNTLCLFGTAAVVGTTMLLSLGVVHAQQAPPGCNWKKCRYEQDTVQQGKIDTALLNQMSALISAQGYSLTNKVLQTCNGWLMEASAPTARRLSSLSTRRRRRSWTPISGDR